MDGESLATHDTNVINHLMKNKTKIAFVLIWSLILIPIGIQFSHIAVLLINSSSNDLFALMGVISGLIFFITFFVGYIVSHVMIAPWLLSKHGIRSLKESYVWMGNCLFAEVELRKLSLEVDDPNITRTMKLITFSKYSIVLAIVGIVTFFALAE